MEKEYSLIINSYFLKEMKIKKKFNLVFSTYSYSKDRNSQFLQAVVTKNQVPHLKN